MKKIFLSLAFVFFSVSAFSASSKDFSLSVEPLFGMKWGQIDEYVFCNNCEYDDDKWSELNWEIKPELYYGLKIRGGWKGFFEETHFMAGIPMETGIMHDSDWQNVQYSGLADYQYKTSYSKSDNYLDYDFIFGFKGGYEFKIKEIFKIKPAVAFDYQNIKFTAKNGIAWYGESSNGYYKPYYTATPETFKNMLQNYNGQDISYKRVAYYFWLGSNFSVDLPYHFIVNTEFFISPYLYMESFDSHLLRGTDFADRTPGNFAAFKWNLGAEYKITERHSILLNAQYFYMRVLRGDDFMKTASSKTYKKATDADGGAGAKYFDISLSYRFTIF
ncbi:MAG: omptin family outer membrane protease [Treponema sp.]|nr:omptin family outer membrane protease [Treponema sp.]